MKLILLPLFAAAFLTRSAWCAAIDTRDGEASLHFGFQTDNGYFRTEDIKYNTTDSKADAGDIKKSNETSTMRPVEYRGGFSFISDDGYEYITKYKANKNGFQPYVTARKIKDI